MTVAVSDLFYYPIKSAKGIASPQLVIGELGPMFDRHWMIVDEEGVFITQREEPRLALIGCSIENDKLVVRIPGANELSFRTDETGKSAEVQVWRHKGTAIDLGDAVARALSQFLGRSARLVRVPADHDRRASSGAKISFVDSEPTLVISQASLDGLNERLAAKMPMERFRPNIVLSGGRAHQEDDWKRIRIGELEFQSAKPCSRCLITTVDPRTGARDGNEPLKTLATYRMRGQEIHFGYFYLAVKPGVINVHDPVEILG